MSSASVKACSNMNAPTSQTMDHEGTFDIDFQEIYHLLREKAWLVLTSILVAGLIGGAYLMRATKLYSARMVIQVEQSERKVVNIEEINKNDLTDRDALKTLEASLASRTLSWRVIESLKLTPVQLGLQDRPEKPYSEKEIVDQVERRVTVHLRRGGQRVCAVQCRAARPDQQGSRPVPRGPGR